MMLSRLRGPAVAAVAAGVLGCHATAPPPTPSGKAAGTSAPSTDAPAVSPLAALDFEALRGKPLPDRLAGCGTTLKPVVLGPHTSAATCEDFRHPSVPGQGRVLLGLEDGTVFTAAVTWKTDPPSDDPKGEWRGYGDRLAAAETARGCQVVDAICFTKVGCSSRERWRLQCGDAEVFGVLDIRDAADAQLSAIDAPSHYMGWVYAPAKPSLAQSDFARIAAFLHAQGVDSLYPLALARGERAQGEGLPRPEGAPAGVRAFAFPALAQAEAQRLCEASGAKLAAPTTTEELDIVRSVLPPGHEAMWIAGGRCASADEAEAFCWDDGSPVGLPFDSGIWVRNGMAAPAGPAPLFLTQDGLVAANPDFAPAGVTGFVCAWR